MAVTGSGIIKFSNIQTEFGGSNPISLSEYYRGGAYTTTNNTGVPTSGAISLSQFYGTTAYVADYTPTAVDWATFYGSDSSGSGLVSASNASKTITGINETITLQLKTTDGYCTKSGTGTIYSNIIIYAFKNGANAGSISMTATVSAQTKTLSFSVASGDTLYFRADYTVSKAVGTCSGTGGGTFSVINTSDGNAVLDTFTIGMDAFYYGGGAGGGGGGGF